MKTEETSTQITIEQLEAHGWKRVTDDPLIMMSKDLTSKVYEDFDPEEDGNIEISILKKMVI